MAKRFFIAFLVDINARKRQYVTNEHRRIGPMWPCLLIMNHDGWQAILLNRGAISKQWQEI